MSTCVGISPYICISAETGGAKKAIAWYKDVFGATVESAMGMGEGYEKIGHAELKFGSTLVMLSDAFPGWTTKTPTELGGNPVNFTVMIPGKSKEVYDKALENGATTHENGEYKKQPWGWNAGTIEDPFGYQWTIGEEAEELTKEQIAERLKMKELKDDF
jgi:PhnB protein